jgi:hypothetical protein
VGSFDEDEKIEDDCVKGGGGFVGGGTGSEAVGDVGDVNSAIEFDVAVAGSDVDEEMDS